MRLDGSRQIDIANLSSGTEQVQLRRCRKRAEEALREERWTWQVVSQMSSYTVGAIVESQFAMEYLADNNQGDPAPWSTERAVPVQNVQGTKR
jgi:hypothetical protein